MLTNLVKFVSRTALIKVPISNFSSAPLILSEERLQRFRTTETDCSNHTNDHIAQFYKISEEDRKKIFLHGGIPKTFDIQTKTFNELCLMIRQPSVDVINCLKQINYSKPPVKFVLYGRKGSGKTLCLAHILHYAHKNEFLIVHIPWLGNWMRRCKEYSNSETKEGFVDLNLDAAAWLLHFKTQNAHILTNPNVKTTVEYIWSKREITPKGSNLTELIDHGINRVKYASNTIVALCNEIKILSTNGIFKTLVAIDGFNAFFYPNTRVYTEKKEVVHPHKITITEGFLNLTKSDWKNGAVVVIVDEIAIADKDQLSYMPRYLLGKDGFEHMDPFVPILVPDYSKKELTSCMDYYRERKWVNDYPGLDEEVEFISGSNPYRLMKVCAPL
ncbi:28S ribosomal protein S29, mitochondrial [Diorhabda carinulata]|uniref:28S ribosomal protein S29, mitochondrial n=1 Tax=Diorhabda carinulata TaxID=1163345 RepID=UPI0025A19B69|nr:28S ribosomal protein S29, mitochondrial [Diorhabda carinulata]